MYTYLTIPRSYILKIKSLNCLELRETTDLISNSYNDIIGKYSIENFEPILRGSPDGYCLNWEEITTGPFSSIGMLIKTDGGPSKSVHTGTLTQFQACRDYRSILQSHHRHPPLKYSSGIVENRPLHPPSE